MEMKPQNLLELQEAIRQAEAILLRGGGTKPALSTAPTGVTTLDLSSLSGMLEYEPGEYVFTALAGTRISEINGQLAEYGQYLPFDPLFVNRGATLGGTVAANSAGPGRYHYGGLRDFLIGVRFVDCAGQLVRGGGKVVKNSAGFDLPKLMVGGLGSFGALYEVTFKVFPRPEAYTTLVYETGSLDQAMRLIIHASSSKVDLDAVDFMPVEHGVTLWIRIAGLVAALPARLERLQGVLGNCTVLLGEEEKHLWSEASEMAWAPQGWSLVKVPITPGQVPLLESTMAASHPKLLRRYSAGGQVAWLATPEAPVALDASLKALGLSGLVLLGEAGEDGPRLGLRGGESFYRRVKQALDPDSRFVEA